MILGSSPSPLTDTRTQVYEDMPWDGKTRLGLPRQKTGRLPFGVLFLNMVDRCTYAELQACRRSGSNTVLPAYLSSDGSSATSCGY